MNGAGQPWDGWGDPYGAWYDVNPFKEIELLGTKWLTVHTLDNETTAQIKAAGSGKGLKDYRSEPHPSRWFQAPTNKIGALYRAAYWTAVAARVAIGRKEAKKATALTAKAQKYRDEAMRGRKLGVDRAGTATDIMSRAGDDLSATGFPAIAKILGAQLKRIGFAREIREQRGAEKAIPGAISATLQGKSLATGKRPWWLWPVVGGVAIVALALVFRPYAQAAAPSRRDRGKN